MIQPNSEIVSFSEIPALSEKAVRSVLLVRHSMRESLQNGNLDPGLTPDGHKYALECGKLLSGWQDVCCGASMRRRTIETVRDLVRGANLPEQEIAPCPAIYDASMFTSEEDFAACLAQDNIHELLGHYFATGNAPKMIDIEQYTAQVTSFLTSEAPAKNLLLSSHDIVIVALLQTLKVRQFQQDDWCGYIQGAFLSLNHDNNWQIHYAVPDKEKRQKYALFI